MPSTEHSLSQISSEEQERRREAVDDATASARLEGVIIPPEITALNERYVEGELTIDELVAKTLELADNYK